MTRDGTVGRSDATEPNLAFHRDIDPVRMMRTRFAHSIRASSPPGLHQQAGHMTASDLCAARQITSGGGGGGSSKEGPRLAGREPGAYRATTMFVHFRETPYGLAMSLVENRRENNRICHEHVASLGSIETPPSVAARIEFWRGLHERLAQLSNRLDAETRGKVMVAVHARVPMVTPEEQRAS